MSRLIFLGAGASFGSIDVTPELPPLGSQLFDKLSQRGGIASQLPQKLQSKFRRNFEKGMAAYYKSSNFDVMQFQRELGLFLAEFSAGPKNAYIELIRMIGNRRCVYSTLNYDLLIEDSAGKLGYGTNYLLENSREWIRLLKLHGSCHFWPRISTAIQNVSFEGFGNAIVDARVEFLQRHEVIHRCNTEDSLAPAIAIYDKRKLVQICDSFVNGQQEKWQKIVANASRICIAGAGINLSDRHIWQPLGESKADIHYFGLTPDRKNFNRWRWCLGKKNMFFVEADFVAAIPEIGKIMR